MNRTPLRLAGPGMVLAAACGLGDRWQTDPQRPRSARARCKLPVAEAIRHFTWRARGLIEKWVPCWGLLAPNKGETVSL